jgi:hypothetical protein
VLARVLAYVVDTLARVPPAGAAQRYLVVVSIAKWFRSVDAREIGHFPHPFRLMVSSEHRQ